VRLSRSFSRCRNLGAAPATAAATATATATATEPTAFPSEPPTAAGNGQISGFKAGCNTRPVIWMGDPTFSSCVPDDPGTKVYFPGAALFFFPQGGRERRGCTFSNADGPRALTRAD
jgi:hypothetical protein